MKAVNLIFISLLMILSCSEQNEFVYPLIQTGEVTDIDNAGAVFHARISDLSNEDIIEYGFVWKLTENPDLNSSRFNLTEAPKTGLISVKVTSDFFTDKVYYVRAFARNSKYTTYGKVVTFRSKGSLAPVIHDFSPKEGSGGTRVIITGENFSGSISGNIVKFGKATGIISEANSDRLIVSLPTDLEVSGKVIISVETANIIAKSKSTFNLLGCNILNFSPVSLIGGDIINVKSENLSSVLQSNILYIGGKKSELVAISNDTLTAYVPYDVIPGKNEVSLTVRGKTCYAYDSLFIRNPWRTITNNMPFDIFNLEGFSIGDQGYAVIGNLVWKFNPENFSWLKCADLPGEYREFIVGFSIGGKGYICFGVNQTYYSYLYEYDPVLNAWSRKADFPGPGRLNSVALVIGGKAFLGLGQAADNSVLRDFWEYDPDNDLWKQLKDYPSVYANETAGFAIDNKAYIGLGTDGHINPSQKDFWEYDPLSDNWTRLSDFPGIVRIRAISFPMGNYGYMGTGWSTNNYGTSLNDFWRFYPLEKKWIRISDIPYRPRYGSIGYVIHNMGYIFAGLYEDQDIIEFNPN